MNQRFHLVKQKHRLNKEIKWSSLNWQNDHIYREFITVLFSFLMEENTLAYRQFFTDRSVIHKETFDKGWDRFGIDVQFKLYYQFLKHMFPILKLPRGSLVKIHLDNHTAQKNKSKLENFISSLWGKQCLKIDYIKSSKSHHIQAIDLITGMSGFRGNKIYFKTQGSTQKKNLKQGFSKYVYNKMRHVDAHHRGTKVFHLFETTSSANYKDNPFAQKIRIWKFAPREHYKDKGWENNRLSKKGEYLGEDLYCMNKSGRWEKMNDEKEDFGRKPIR